VNIGDTGEASRCRIWKHHFDPKSYIRLDPIAHFYMKIVALILLLSISSGSVAQGSMHPYSGSDSYGQGLSYPDNLGSFSISSFPAENNTTGPKSVYLGAAAFQPNNSSIEPINSSDYYHITHPTWDQFANYLPLTSIHEWFSKYSKNSPPEVPNFLRDDWRPASEGMATPTMKQFAKEDSYREGVEPHNDPDRMELNHFLDSDEPPGRPLL